MITTSWRMRLSVAAGGGALLFALLRCGSDPFAGTAYPANAQAGYPSDEYGTCLTAGCTNGQFAIAYAGEEDAQCGSVPTYWLCAGSYYGAFVCSDPSGQGWTQGTCQEGTEDSDSDTFDAGDTFEDSAADGGDSDDGGDSESSESSGGSLGNPCTSDSECSGFCAGLATLGYGFCSEDCTSSVQCPNVPAMYCIENGDNFDSCFVTCDTTADCAQFGDAFTCQSLNDVEGSPIDVCATSS